jgi:hypothetical protein
MPGHERHSHATQRLGACRSNGRNYFLSMSRVAGTGILMLGFAGPRAQAIDAQRTIDGAAAKPRWRVHTRSGRLPPLTRARAKSPFEASVEETQVVETAFLGHVDDLGVRVP